MIDSHARGEYPAAHERRRELERLGWRALPVGALAPSADERRAAVAAFADLIDATARRDHRAMLVATYHLRQPGWSIVATGSGRRS